MRNDPRRCSAFPHCQAKASASACAGGRAGAEAGASVSAEAIAVDASVFEGGQDMTQPKEREKFEFKPDPVQALVDAMSSLPFWDKGASLIVDFWTKAREKK